MGSDLGAISNILEVIGSLGLFIYGMKVMSEGVQRAAGAQMRNILRSITKNRYIGVFSGFLITALVQSSSVTTVMTVSFVNAGLLTLAESAGVMMGANVGTTITGWMLAVLGFKINVSAYTVPLFGIGLPLLFSIRGKLKYWGEFIIGFALLFLGLSLLKEAIPDIKNNQEVLDFLRTFTEWGYFSSLFFVFVGTVITIILQSSSAAMAITLAMCTQGWLPFEVAAAMILGENIGTTITAELASLVGNPDARRSARIHSIFNVIGVIWMVFLLPYFLPLISTFVQAVFDTNDPFTNGDDMPIALAAFHTFFNLANVLILISFTSWLIQAAKWSVRSKEEDEVTRLQFIGSNTRTPELALGELQKETGHFGEVVSRMSGFLKKLLNSTESKEQQKMLKRMEKYEGISDKMEMEITEYITKLSNQEITPETSLRLRSILNVCNDLERIGDVYFQISKTIEQKIENRIYFTPQQRNNLNELITKIDEAFKVMVSNLQAVDYKKVSKDKALQIEQEINQLKKQLREEHLEQLGQEDYNVRSAMIYNNVFSALEKVGDHIINVTESITGEV